MPAPNRYVCMFCHDPWDLKTICLRCGGAGWITEEHLVLLLKRKYCVLVAKKIVGDINEVPREADLKSVLLSGESLTIEQYREIKVWEESGRVDMALRDMPTDVLKATFRVAGMEFPPLWEEP